MTSASPSTKLTLREGVQLRKAERLSDETLRQNLREVASYVHHDFMRPEDLRELAALCLVASRRWQPL